MRWFERKWALFLLLTCSFALVYAVNNALTDSLRLVPGAHLVHLPSGIKLVMVLIFEWIGAASIAVVSVLAGYFFYFPEQAGVSAALALINALAPWLTLKLVAGGDMDGWIARLTPQRFIATGLVFAGLNSAMNQLVIYWDGLTENIINGMGVMFVGDITGVYITLALLKVLSHLLRSRRRS